MTDHKSEDTIYIAFTTRAFATGIPTTLAGTPVVSAYENADLTQITAGITLGVDHDGVTGLHMLTIVATAANGYDTGKDYNLVITTGTVGGVSVVGEVVGRFTLDRSAAAQDLANGTDGLGAIKGDTASILVDTAEIGTAGAGLSNISLPATGLDAILKSSTFALAMADAIWDELLAGHITADSAGLVLNEWQDAGRLDAILDTIAADVVNIDGAAMRGTDSAALASVCTEVRLAELDAANLPTDAANIEADTQDIQSRLPAALVGGRMDSNVSALENDTDASGKLAAHAKETLPVTFSAGGSTTTAVLNLVDGAAASATDDVYIGRILVFNNSTLDHQVTEITDYVGATKTATITAVTTAPGAAHTARML